MKQRLFHLLLAIGIVFGIASCDSRVSRDEAEAIAKEAFLQVASEKGLDPEQFFAPTQRASQDAYLFDFDGKNKNHFISVTVRENGAYRTHYLDATK